MFSTDRLGEEGNTEKLLTLAEVFFGAMKTFWDLTKLAYNTVNVRNATGLSIKVVSFK